MANEKEALITKVFGSGILLACLTVACLVTYLFSEKHKAKHTAYVGEFQGQHVRYMEFPDRNEMEIGGKNGLYTLTDSEGFHRLGDPLGTNDILEKVVFTAGNSTVNYERNNTNSSILERGIAQDVLARSGQHYNTIRKMARENGILKLEDDEPKK